MTVGVLDMQKIMDKVNRCAMHVNMKESWSGQKKRFREGFYSIRASSQPFKKKALLIYILFSSFL